ncbi:MAG TPA: tRNA lysidine(34) synthetase TilS [Candidatus Saccharimonadaceae bacterium]|jgi:tRNA(Ile)-lysidine synthase|nr:tRNA lysidine(34) synthetase TilS [Candidatus Saccharimonadaceae bacterium]
MRLRRIEPIVRRALVARRAALSGSRLLVAVSGGADSTALLVALHRLAPEFGFDLHAAHLDHGLRGAEARADRASVEALCRARGVPLHAAAWNTRLRMKRRGLSGHAGLRTLRREFLLAAARRAGAVAIATAHTADDQLETLLMRLARGAGLRGLGAMRARQGRWLKPLLGATRADIERDLTRAGLAWREDRSNHDSHYLRTRVRDDVVPALAAAARVPRAVLAAHAARAAREIDAAREALERSARALLKGALAEAARRADGALALDAARLAAAPAAVRRLALRAAWAAFAPGAPGLTHHHVGALERAVRSSKTGAHVLLPGRATAGRVSGVLRFRAAPAPNPRGSRPGASRAEGPRRW